MKIFGDHELKTSVLDDFSHYNKCEEEEKQKGVKSPSASHPQYRLLDSKPRNGKEIEANSGVNTTDTN